MRSRCSCRVRICKVTRVNALRARLRQVSRDLVTLIFGVAVLLVWAGFVEAFLSQYHEPIIPYWAKILFGAVELCLLALFLAKSGGKPAQHAEPGTRNADQN